VKVSLPDDQVVEARAIRRARDHEGIWWYEVELTLYSRLEVTATHSRAEPQPVQFWAPYPLVQPIEGERYDALEATTAAERVWPVARRPLPQGVVHVVHRPGCYQAHGTPELVTADTARRLLREGRAQGCTVCRVERALRNQQRIG
jgi:hypothetical protein